MSNDPTPDRPDQPKPDNDPDTEPDPDAPVEPDQPDVQVNIDNGA